MHTLFKDVMQSQNTCITCLKNTWLKMAKFDKTKEWTM
jgi:hypothetical protein